VVVINMPLTRGGAANRTSTTLIREHSVELAGRNSITLEAMVRLGAGQDLIALFLIAGAIVGVLMPSILGRTCAIHLTHKYGIRCTPF
jgi:hypothetical protein